MSKAIGKIVCDFCGTASNVYPGDMKFEEFECDGCHCTLFLPETVEELEAWNQEAKTAINERYQATHVRIMVRGEDGHDFCVKNGVSKDNDLLKLALYAVEQSYPEGKVFLEDEESTNPALITDMYFGD